MALLDPASMESLMSRMRRHGVVSFRVRDGDQELEVHWPAAAPGAVAEHVEVEVEEDWSGTPGTLHAILSPTVGTYFSSSEPGKAPFVQIGQRVMVGQTICVVESMKLMSEIVSDVDGVIQELPVPNGGSVKAGQVLGLVRLDHER
ncbi:MAG: biotin/lipoyl-containing protein [Pseudomonadota bacterium]